jgi:hypothetical protein
MATGTVKMTPRSDSKRRTRTLLVARSKRQKGHAQGESV